MQGGNETFPMLVLCILFPGTRGAFLDVIYQLFSIHKAKISRVALIQRQTLPHIIILGCELVLAPRNPILQLPLGRNELNFCCRKQTRKGEQVLNPGGWGHLKETALVDTY